MLQTYVANEKNILPCLIIMTTFPSLPISKFQLYFLLGCSIFLLSLFNNKIIFGILKFSILQLLLIPSFYGFWISWYFYLPWGNTFLFTSCLISLLVSYIFVWVYTPPPQPPPLLISFWISMPLPSLGLGKGIRH